ncbi:MAG: hypothetical protein OXI81_06930 [Paracoccaceae bacterium]|nr:hypothetical protein [Paracoccaceae bacterium]
MPADISLSFWGIHAHDFHCMLRMQLAAATGAACATGIPEPSHVSRAIGYKDKRDGNRAVALSGMARLDAEKGWLRHIVPKPYRRP